MSKKLITIVELPILIASGIFAVFVIEAVWPGNFYYLGIEPRTISGLAGIVFSPFLHASWTHLVSNLVPLVIMGCFISALAPSLYLLRTIALIVISGSLTWLTSTAGVVIGASGLVFAYWSYLITNGFITRKTKDLLIGLVTFLVYGALIFSLFRVEEGVSWAGHFSGVMAGILLALQQAKKA